MTKQEALEKVKKYGGNLKDLSDFQNDEDVVLEALKDTNGFILEYTSDELKLSKEFILKALDEKIPYIFENINDKLKSDKDIISSALKNDNSCSVLGNMDSNFKIDRDMALDAVKNNCYAIKYLDEEFTHDKEIGLYSVAKDGEMIKFLSEDLKKDKDIVYKAIDSKKGLWFAFKEIGDIFKDDKGLILKAVSFDGNILSYASDRLKSDREVVLAAIKSNPNALKYVDKELCDDRELVFEAVKNKGFVLEYASAKLKSDIEIVSEAMKDSVNYLNYASKKLRDDKNLLREYVKYFKDDDCQTFKKFMQRVNSGWEYDISNLNTTLVEDIWSELSLKNSYVNISTSLLGELEESFKDYENFILDDKGIKKFIKFLKDYMKQFEQLGKVVKYYFLIDEKTKVIDKSPFLDLSPKNLSTDGIVKLWNKIVNDESILIYLELKDEIDLDSELLNLSEKESNSFTAYLFLPNSGWVRQIYDCGEYDTGFASGRYSEYYYEKAILKREGELFITLASKIKELMKN